MKLPTTSPLILYTIMVFIAGFFTGAQYAEKYLIVTRGATKLPAPPIYVTFADGCDSDDTIQFNLKPKDSIADVEIYRTECDTVSISKISINGDKLNAEQYFIMNRYNRSFSKQNLSAIP